MIEAAEAVQGYVSAMSKQTFLKDRRTQEAVIFNIIKIGEAATKLRQNHPDFTAQHSQIDWRAICSMRNRMRMDILISMKTLCGRPRKGRYQDC